MTKHDEICLMLTTERLLTLLDKRFELKKTLMKQSLSVEMLPSSKTTLAIQKINEYVLVKGHGQFATSKGFADIICHIQTINPQKRTIWRYVPDKLPKDITKNGWRYLYEENISTCSEIENIEKATTVDFIPELQEYFIEVKTRQELDADLGAVLRQLREYEKYYGVCCPRWESDLLACTKEEYARFHTRMPWKIELKFVLIVESIDEKTKNFLEEAGFPVISLNEELKQEKA